jgi:hypothetical protein
MGVLQPPFRSLHAFLSTPSSRSALPIALGCHLLFHLLHALTLLLCHESLDTNRFSYKDALLPIRHAFQVHETKQHIPLETPVPIPAGEELFVGAFKEAILLSWVWSGKLAVMARSWFLQGVKVRAA